MKLVARKANIQKSEDFEQNNFRINASAQAFKILSDGLYSNKIRAVIREISCNAADAHKAAGNSDPFIVTLPNTMNSEFKVRDFGTGLSHENVMELYTTYFLSDKNHTNDVTGGFGLGSKSPFAYADNFDVVSFFNGEKRTYCAIIGSTGAPEINLMSVEETDEPNGLEVSFPVNRHDVSRFSDEASTVLKAFKQKPTIKGFAGTLDMEEDEENIFLQGKDWTLRTRSYYYDNNSVIRMGNVDYPFPDELNSCDESTLFQNADLIVEVPVGFVDPTPSRETLSMNPTSVAALKGKLKSIAKEINVLIQKDVAQCKSVWEARLAFRKYTTNGSPVASAAAQLIDWKWKGQEVEDTLNLRKVFGDKRTEIEIISYSKTERYVKGDYKDVVSSTKVEGRFHPDANDVFLLDDYEKKADYKVRNYIRELGDDSKRYVLITTAVKARLKEFLKALGISSKELVSVTGLPLPPKKARTYTPTARGPKVDGDAPAFLFTGQGAYADEDWEPEKVNVNTDSGYYIEIRRWKPVYTQEGDLPRDILSSSITYIKDSLKLFGIEVDKVYGVKTAKLDKFKESDNWENLIEVARKKIDEVNNDVDLNSCQVIDDEYNAAQRFLPNGSYYNKKRALKNLCYFFTSNKDKFDEDGVFYKKMKSISDFVGEGDISKKSEALRCLKRVALHDPKIDKTLQTRNVYDEAADALGHYPMLEVLASSNVNTLTSNGNKETILEYIKLIDSTTK